MSTTSFNARIAALYFARTAVAETKRGRLSERESHIACIDAEISFLRRCEAKKEAIAIILGETNR